MGSTIEVDEDGFEIVPPGLLFSSPSGSRPAPGSWNPMSGTATVASNDRSFEKFEEKKRAQGAGKSFRSIFKRASTFRESSRNVSSPALSSLTPGK